MKKKKKLIKSTPLPDFTIFVGTGLYEIVNKYFKNILEQNNKSKHK